LAEVDVTAGQATLSWDEVPGATLYQVYRDGIPLGSPTASTFYVDSSVVPETAYSYQVQALNSSGSSELSDALPVTTLANSAPVWALTTLSASLGAAYSLDLNSVCTDGDAHALTFALTSGSVPGLSLLGSTYSGTPTADGTSSLVFDAFDGYDHSTVVVPFVVSDPDVVAPTVPTGVSAVAVGSTVTVSWAASTDAASGVATYKVYRNGIFRASDTASPYVESGVPVGTYSYTVSAVDSSANANESAQSTGSSVTIVADTLDAPVSFVAAPDGVGSIDISWLEGPNGAVSTGYELQRSTNQTTWTNVEEYVSPALSVTDDGLVASTLYYYRVRGTRSGFTPSAYATTSAQNVVVTPPTGTTDTNFTYQGAWPTTDGAIVVGWDWTMPNTAQPADECGVITINNSAYPSGWQGHKIKCINAAWGGKGSTAAARRATALEPTQGDYRMDRITGPMADTAYDGVFLNVRGFVVNTTVNPSAEISAPEWLTTPTYTTTGGSATITSLLIRNSNVKTRHFALIDAIRDAGILADSRLWQQILHLPSSSRGEEFNTTQGGSVVNGVNEDYTAAKEYITKWADAAGANKKKIMWTDDYGQVDTAASGYLWQHAVVTKGLGSRGGAIEWWLFNQYTPSEDGTNQQYCGQTWTLASGSTNNEGYLGVDETNLCIANGRGWHDQNEVYSDPASAVQQQNYRMAHLRTMQMRRRIVGVDDGYQMNPKMDNWLSLDAGYTAATAQQAWICLMRTWTRSGGNRGIRNFEKWLYQRDIYGATTPTVQKDHGPLTSASSNKSQNTGLPTSLWNIDLARQGTSIGIAVDDDFIDAGTSDSVCIKVTYLDSGSSTWNLQYTRTNGTTATKSVTCTNTKVVRTATFFISDFKNPASGLVPDFYLKSSNASVPFMFVRVIKV
jgi:hypothetical protein